MKKPARKRSPKFECSYENEYDFAGVVFTKDGDRIDSLWVDTREKSDQIIEFVNRIIKEVRKA
jgi:hypothetical protein